MLRCAGVLLLGLGCVGAATAGAPTSTGPVDVYATSEILTGSASEPSGVPVRQSTLAMRYRGQGWAVQAELPWRRVAGVAAGLPQAPGSRAGDEGPGEARVTLAVPLRAPGGGGTGLDLVLAASRPSRVAVAGVAPGDPAQSMFLTLRRPLGDWNVFGNVGWLRGGTLPGLDPARSAWQGAVGVNRLVAARIEAGAYADLRQRVGGDPALPEATVYAAFRAGERSWQVFARRSFAPAVPDVGIGLSWRASF